MSATREPKKSVKKKTVKKKKTAVKDPKTLKVVCDNGMVNFYDVIDNKDTAKYHNPTDSVLQHPMRAIILGASGSKKTNTLINIIAQLGCWEQFFIVTKIPDEPLYKFLNETLNEADPGCCLITSDFREIGNPEEMCQKKQKLIVFDDQILADKNDMKTICELYIKGRKHNCSTFFISQSFCGKQGIPLIIRNNCTHLLVKSIHSTRELKTLIREYNLANTPTEVKEVIDCYKDYSAGDNCFTIDFLNGNKFHKNF
jgi:hypothetical protein